MRCAFGLWGFFLAWGFEALFSVSGMGDDVSLYNPKLIIQVEY